jgi:hypothetical protein
MQPITLIGFFGFIIAGVVLVIVGEQITPSVVNAVSPTVKQFPFVAVGIGLIVVALGFRGIVVFWDELCNMISNIFNS